MLPWLQDAWRLFLDRIDADRLAHALLVRGPEGTGKMQLAIAMAKRLLCTDAGTGSGACGTCRSCVLFDDGAGAHPDWFLLVPEEGKHQVQIDPIREATRGLNLTTTVSPRKAALIAPAEAMNRNAANALLKSLEEPQGETYMLLVSHDPSRLPVTIRSRCQSIPVNLPEAAQAMEWLVKENGIDGRTAEAALEAAGGAPLRALYYAQAGLVEQYREVKMQLSELRSGRGTASVAVTRLQEIEPDALWQWLSLEAAASFRASAGRGQSAPGLAGLQQSADRNRTLARTAVRQDLLLQQWLIEWSAANGGETGN